MADDKLGSKGQAWFCTTGLPSDVVVEVDGMTYHLHKFPLMSKSKKLHDLITELEQNPITRKIREYNQQVENEDSEIEEEEELPQIPLPSFPGGAETFGTAAKYCYGVKIDLNVSNAAALRCAAEYLEMTEEFSEDNLISRTERFLAQSVFRNLRASIKALKACENLSPLCETLGIVERCVESIATRAANSSVSSSIFGWPITEGSRRDLRVRKNGISGGSEPWFEDLTALSLPIFKRVITAMKDKDLSSELIESSLISYAIRSIPGLSRSNRHLSSSSQSTSEVDQKELLETVITNLPLNKSAAANTTRFLFRLLRTINIVQASEAARMALERKIAWQLDEATVDDLLMPNYSYSVETLYDVASVERIVGYYLVAMEGIGCGCEVAVRSPVGEGSRSGSGVRRVGRLVDGYLAEIASDVNVKVHRFCDLAMALPEDARVYDDGLYRAVDLYLKAHPGISEEERDKVCSVMDCRKLTLEACTHAAQNERLPLRAVVQVLFFEQLQLRHAIAGTLIAANAVGASEQHRSGSMLPRESDAWRTAISENQVLRLDMDSMRRKVQELERECTNMKKAIEKKVDKKAERGGGEGGARIGKGLGCKFGTKVCDSQGRTVMEPKKSQTELQSGL